MLGALLLNIPPFTQHGPGPVKSYGTTWNPRWSEMYGPDADRLKDDAEAVKEAEESLKAAEYVPEPIREIKEVLHRRSLVDELEAYQPDTEYYLVYLLEAWLFYCEWKKQDEEAIAMALLMLD